MFVQNCKIYAEELPVNEVTGITNSGKFSRSSTICVLASLFLETQRRRLYKQPTHENVLSFQLAQSYTQRYVSLTLSNGASVCPPPSARTLGFIFDAHLTFSDQISALARSCFYHIRDLRRIRPVLDFSTAPHHWHITRTLKARLLQLTVLWSSKNTVKSSPAYPEFSCSCRCCSSQVF